MGFIKLDRDIESHWLWSDKPFSKGQAWIDLLLLAQYKDNEVFVKGKLVSRKRGEVHISYAALADRWGWSRDKVRRFIALLEKEKMATSNATTHNTTVTIENYSIYQDTCATSKTTDNTTDNTTGNTTDNTTDDTQLKKEEKEEKDKNRESVRARTRGKFRNVSLTDTEYRDLADLYSNAEELIEKVSLYKAKSGKQYESDYAAILSFAVRDGKPKPRAVNKYNQYLAEAKAGFSPPANADLTDEERAELELIAYEVWKEKR